MQSLSELFNTPQSKNARKSLDYLDGKQLEYVIKQLDDPNGGRKQWKQRGMKAIYRNVLGMIVNKSGLLFKDGSPKLELFKDAKINDQQSELLSQALGDNDFNEFMINFDVVVRLLKTGVILTQYNDETKELIFDILHQGNCVVIYDSLSKQISQLTYKTGSDDAYDYFRVYDNETIKDYRESKDAQGMEPELVERQDNPYGKIPAAAFHDTNIPRTGFWNVQPQDLTVLNDMYNMNLVDLEFAASWSVHQTLYTNCMIQSEASGSLETSEVYGGVVPRQGDVSGDSLIGGLSRVIQLDSNGVDNPFVEYKGPDLNLEMPARLFQGWVKAYAEDWSVRVKVDGEGQANSGFQLVVEELPNLELRQQRSRMMEAGMKRLYKCISTVWNQYEAKKLSEDLVLYASFSEPKLPVNRKDEEETWSLRIAEGRASRVDYLMDVKSLTKEEAELKIKEIDAMGDNIVAPGFVEGL